MNFPKKKEKAKELLLKFLKKEDIDRDFKKDLITVYNNLFNDCLTIDSKVK